MANKQVRLNVNTALSRIDAMVPLIYRDTRAAINVESALEAANAIVMKELKRKEFYGSQCYNTVALSLSLQLALILAKLFEIPNIKKGEFSASRFNRSDVASIPLLIRLLKQKRCSKALQRRARSWIPSTPSWADSQAQACERAINLAVKNYDTLLGSTNGRISLERLKLFRDKILAHNLLSEALDKRPSYEDLFMLTDVARDVTENAKFAVLGDNLSLSELEAERMKMSKAFWQEALVAASNKDNTK